MINPDSALCREFWEKGYSSDCPIIDMHAHMGNHAGAFMPARSIDDVVARMDKINVRQCFFVGHRALFSGQTASLLDIADAARYPGRFRVYFPVYANGLDPARDLDTVAKNPLYAGFKLFGDYYGVPISDERHAPYLEYANGNRLPVLCHTWGGSKFDGPEEAERLLTRYPDLALVAGHSFHGDWDGAVRLAKRYKNLYLELTAVLDDVGVLERFVDAGVGDQLLFGVDAPWFSYEFGVGAVLSAKIDDTARRKILYQNAGRILAGMKRQ